MDFEMGMAASMLPPARQGLSVRLPVSEPDPSLSLPALPPSLPLSDMRKPAATFRFAPTSRRALVLVGHSAAQKGDGRSHAELRVDSLLTGMQRSASVGDVGVPLASGASCSIVEPRVMLQSTSIAVPQQMPSIALFTLDAASVQELERDETARYAGPSLPHHALFISVSRIFTIFCCALRVLSTDCSGGFACRNSIHSIRVFSTMRAP